MARNSDEELGRGITLRLAGGDHAFVRGGESAERDAIEHEAHGHKDVNKVKKPILIRTTTCDPNVTTSQGSGRALALWPYGYM